VEPHADLRQAVRALTGHDGGSWLLVANTYERDSFALMTPLAAHSGRSRELVALRRDGASAANEGGLVMAAAGSDNSTALTTSRATHSGNETAR